MIKKTIIGVFTLILISCSSDNSDFIGIWINKKNENEKLIIEKNGENYIVSNGEKKYPAQVKEGLLEISADLPLKATIYDKNNLIINGIEYLRFKKPKEYIIIKSKDTKAQEKFGKIFFKSLKSNDFEEFKNYFPEPPIDFYYNGEIKVSLTEKNISQIILGMEYSFREISNIVISQNLEIDEIKVDNSSYKQSDIALIVKNKKYIINFKECLEYEKKFFPEKISFKEIN
ncbi:hypothetical protein [Winogradskyella sediminis]|uniref:hypothetical protein n=1 Tax=Winogradskyella sediminis TaxID=1382466 RepID=UPI003AA8B09D